jgi:hypothetical protein
MYADLIAKNNTYHRDTEAQRKASGDRMIGCSNPNPHHRGTETQRKLI